MDLILLVLLPVLAFGAAFRGWGWWPFALLALPFAPDVAHAAGHGLPNRGALPLQITVGGLVLMVLTGRRT